MTLAAGRTITYAGRRRYAAVPAEARAPRHRATDEPASAAFRAAAADALRYAGRGLTLAHPFARVALLILLAVGAGVVLALVLTVVVGSLPIVNGPDGATLITPSHPGGRTR